MKRVAIVLGLVALLSVAVNSQAGAQHYVGGPGWLFHQRALLGGQVTVWGTINCVPAWKVFDQPVIFCHTVGGWIPSFCNDFLVVNTRVGRPPGWWKAAVPFKVGPLWTLQPLRSWLLPWVPSPGDTLPACPTIGDSTGVVDSVYVVVRLDQWLTNPQPLQDTYQIVNGMCAQLPGYLIGTTPIVFTPSGPDPFTTTRFTGTLWLDGDVTFTNIPAQPALSEWGVIALVLTLAGIAVVFVLRRRARVAA